MAKLTPDQRGEVNNLLTTLRVLVGARGTTLAFNDVIMVSNSVGTSIVLQCVSRTLGVKFGAEFVTYGFDSEAAVLSKEPWIDGPVAAPVKLSMLVTELKDSSSVEHVKQGPP